MGNIRITELPVAAELGAPPGAEDILLVCFAPARIVKRCTVDVLLRSIPVKVLLEHVLQRLEERRSR